MAMIAMIGNILLNFFICSRKSWLPLYRLPRHWPSVTVTGRPWLASQVAAMLCEACAGEAGR